MATTHSLISVPTGTWTEVDLLTKTVVVLQNRGREPLFWTIAGSEPAAGVDSGAHFAMLPDHPPLSVEVESGDGVWVWSAVAGRLMVAR